jgi:hypothetical protein
VWGESEFLGINTRDVRLDLIALLKKIRLTVQLLPAMMDVLG